MKLTKGLKTDFDVLNQPPESWSKAMNMVLTRKGDLENENGFEKIVNDIGALVGVIETPTKAIFFTRNSDETSTYSNILSFNGSSITTILRIKSTIANDKLLKFDIAYPIKGTYTYNSLGELIIAWTDGHTPLCLLNINNLPVTVDNNKLFVDSGTGDDLTLLYQKPFRKQPVFDLLSVEDSGGNLLTGVYHIAIKYKLPGGEYTGYSRVCNQIIITNNYLNNPLYDYDGCNSGLPTSKSIKLAVIDIDKKYKQYRYAVIAVRNGITTAFEIDYDFTIPTTKTADNFYYDVINYTGQEPVIDITLDEILIEDSSVIAKTLTSLDNRLYRFNTKGVYDIKYQKFANLIKVKWTYENTIKVPTPSKLVTVDEITSSYKNPVNIFSKKGFMAGEVYALYCRWWFKDGTSSPAYHIPASNDYGVHLIGDINDYDLPANWTVVDAYNSVQYNDFLAEDKESIRQLTYITPYALLSKFYSTARQDPNRSMGCFINENETYPYTDNNDFNSLYDYNGYLMSTNYGLSGENLEGTPVRHFKFPELRQLTQWGHYHYHEGQSYILGLEFSNIKVPEEIKDLVQGIEFLYAKRDVSNSTIIGQDLVINNNLYPGYKLSDGFNHLVAGEFRFHSFDMFKANELVQATPSFLEIVYLDTNLGYESPIKNIRIISDGKYLPCDNISANNELQESCFLGTINNACGHDQYKNIGNLVAYRQDVYFPFINQNLISLSLFKGQSVSQGTYYIEVADNYNIYLLHTATSLALTLNGDTFKNICGFRRNYAYPSTDPISRDCGRSRFLQGVNEEGTYSIIEQYSHGGLRTRGQNYWEKYVPLIYQFDDGFGITAIVPYIYDVNCATDPEPPNINYYDATLNSIGKIPDWFGYNTDFTRNNIFVKTFPETFQPRQIEFVHRISRSAVQSSESSNVQWRFFPINEYKDINSAKGDGVCLITYNKILIIQTEYMTFFSSIKDVLKTENNNAFLSEGDVFDREPEESQSGVVAYTGNQNQFGVCVCKHGVVWADILNRKIFLFNGTRYEISNKDTQLFFNEVLATVEGDNPFLSGGVNIVYDEIFDRLICKFEETVISFSFKNNEWTSLHSYTPNYMFTLNNKVYSFFLNTEEEILGEIWLHNTNNVGSYYQGVTPIIHYSYIEVVLNSYAELCKIWQSLFWKSRVEEFVNELEIDKLSTGRVMQDYTFTHIIVSNKGQCSGLITLQQRAGRFAARVNTLYKPANIDELGNNLITENGVQEQINLQTPCNYKRETILMRHENLNKETDGFWFFNGFLDMVIDIDRKFDIEACTFTNPFGTITKTTDNNLANWLTRTNRKLWYNKPAILREKNPFKIQDFISEHLVVRLYYDNLANQKIKVFEIGANVKTTSISNFIKQS